MISEEDLLLLSAFEDGELEGQQLLSLRRRLLREPELRRELDAIRSTDRKLRDYASGMDSTPVPASISRLVRAPVSKSAVKLFAAAAAMFVMTIGTYFVIPTEKDTDYDILATIESGQTIDLGDSYIEVLASFQHIDGRYCREMINNESHWIVCLTDGSWTSVINATRLDLPEGVYQPAGGDSAAIDSYVRDHMAGSVIERAQERRLMQNDWQPPI